jgi:hypothetical protein
MSTHKQGCEALGGYGHGIGPCTCQPMSTEAQKLGGRLTKLADSLDKSLSDGAYVTPGFDVYLVKRLLREAAVALASSQDRLSEAEQALQALREEVEGLRRDAERIDWLDRQNLNEIGFSNVEDDGEKRITSISAYERNDRGYWEPNTYHGDSLRTAIDAAIRNGGEG